MAMPVIAAATPEVEFNREMVMGISAPPTGRANSRPKIRLAAIRSQAIAIWAEGTIMASAARSAIRMIEAASRRR